MSALGVSFTSRPALGLPSAAVWRATGAATHPATALPSGHGDLDAELAGGWPCGGLVELLAQPWAPVDAPSGPSAMAWRLLTPALARLSQQGRPVVLVAPPQALDALAVQQAGLALSSMLVVRTGQVADTLWAAEQALKALGAAGDGGSASAEAAVGAVVTWLPAAVPPGALRRLQLTALGKDGSSRALSVVVRPALAQQQPSPAPLRLLVTPSAGQRVAVTVFKRRGPPMTKPLWLHLPVTARRPVHQPTQPLHTLHDPLQEAVASVLQRLQAAAASGSLSASEPRQSLAL